MNFKDLPILHTYLSDYAGTFCGIVGGTKDQPFAAVILLDTKPAEALNWADALAWGQSLGDGCHIPTRDQSANLYANGRDLFDLSDWYWTSTEYTAHSDSDAWTQDFNDGAQFALHDSGIYLCRAVRLIHLDFKK